ncbi:hypothetical protein GCM10009526_23280 [Glutamicibacter creatinolyticus]
MQVWWIQRFPQCPSPRQTREIAFVNLPGDKRIAVFSPIAYLGDFGPVCAYARTNMLTPVDGRGANNRVVGQRRRGV